MNSDERAAELGRDNEIEVVHSDAASQGQSEQKAAHEDVDTHFICFVDVDGHLYEYDGRKHAPINHGECSRENLLPVACTVIQQFMDRDPGEMRFTIVALVSTAQN